MGSNQLILHKNLTPISTPRTTTVGTQFMPPATRRMALAENASNYAPYMIIFLQVPQSSQAIRHDLGIVLGGIFSFEIAQFGQLGEDAGNALLNGLFIGFNH